MTEQDIFESQAIHRLCMGADDRVTFWDILDFAFINQIELCIHPTKEWDAVRVSMQKGAVYTDTILEIDDTYMYTEEGKHKFICEKMNYMLHELIEEKKDDQT